ncbi:hypothetical protein Vadar_016059 [Vaccinium darrowii]|uniref:Uncharacterized protein n=1 Tax=Vaccinium darrowii TaxID=229202 RepID=A0ACB7ZCY3_9ERIC|nr:hypothetical protein Vadar_016059 [Vaccinium darrowii]
MAEVESDDSHELQSDGTNAVQSQDPLAPASAKRLKSGVGVGVLLEKYYLVDDGYPNAKGYMAPYKGCMYHQDDFRHQRRPLRDSKERLNRVHSSLTSCVERAFGVWKTRWRMMKTAPGYKIHDHTKFILISMAIHNYIRIHCQSDKYFRNAEMENEDYVFDDTESHELHVEANEAVQSQSDFAVVDEYMDSL